MTYIMFFTNNPWKSNQAHPPPKESKKWNKPEFPEIFAELQFTKS